MNNSDASMNPSGGDDVWRADIKPALDNQMERILERNNVQKAWERVKSNRGAAGIDGMAIGDFLDYAKAHWAEIRASLMDGTYQPQPVRQVVIPKPRGGERKLGIPSVIDRVIQQAILQVLSPVFEPGFVTTQAGERERKGSQETPV
jgi:RNA-directed DNA polymerase